MWRLLWCISLGVLACIATVAQVDRHAHELPALADWVPERFRNFALVRQAATEAAEGSPGRAVTDARRLIILHPIPAENLTILAIAEHRAGNEFRSAHALTLAAQRGWREPLAQQAVALAAAKSGQGKIAADRLSALWRTAVGKPFARELTVQLLEVPDVRNHFAAKLDNEKAWVPSFLNWAVSNISPSVFTNLVEAANQRGAKFDCSFINKAARSMLQNGALSLAKRLWESQCEAQSNSFDFSDLASSADLTQDPFSWVFPPSVGLTVSSSHGGINFENRDPIRRLFAKKYMALSPGRHTIQVLSNNKAPLSRLILARVRCLGNVNIHEMGVLIYDVSSGLWALDIPNKGCPVQAFDLLVNQGVGENIRVIVDENINFL